MSGYSFAEEWPGQAAWGRKSHSHHHRHGPPQWAFSRGKGSHGRPSPEERHGHYYTKAALLDAYEVLRQLVDNTDEMANCIVIVVASPAFLSDVPRGLDAYQALKLRIFDEVRDVNRDNPLSSLIRLRAA